jgi:DNA-binding transcriptional regulator YdaS (Cro superfamily)
MVHSVCNAGVPKKTPLERAIAHAGGLTRLAKAISSTPQAVHNWKTRGRVPAEYCISIEAATGRAVTRYDLLPEVFGKPEQEAA